jgi:hypothetical protein
MVLIGIALLLGVLAVGSVTAVTLFPARAGVQHAAAAASRPLSRSHVIGGDAWSGPLGRLAASRPLSRSHVIGLDAWSGPLGRLDERASIAGAGLGAWSGPLGRLDERASIAGTGLGASGPLGR